MEAVYLRMATVVCSGEKLLTLLQYEALMLNEQTFEGAIELCSVRSIIISSQF